MDGHGSLTTPSWPMESYLRSRFGSLHENRTNDGQRDSFRCFFGSELYRPNRLFIFMNQHDHLQKSSDSSGTVTTLDKVPPPGECRVVAVPARGPFRTRLLAMGFVPGAGIEVLRAAPLGDPVEYRVKGYCISLRKEEARLISVSTGGVDP